MRNRLILTTTALLFSAWLVPDMSKADTGDGVIGGDDAQRASKVLTQMFGRYDAAHRCWPVAAQGAAPASCVGLVQAVGVDASSGTELHVLLGGTGVTEMVTLGRNAAPEGWTVLSRSAAIANGTGDAPAEAKDLRFEKLGATSWGWVGRSGADQKFVVYMAKGSEIASSGEMAPAGKPSANATLHADASDPTRPHYPLAVAQAGDREPGAAAVPAQPGAPAIGTPPARTTIAGIRDSWYYDEVAHNYEPVSRFHDLQLAATAQPSASPTRGRTSTAPHAAEHAPIASTELADAGPIAPVMPPTVHPSVATAEAAPAPVVIASESAPQHVARRAHATTRLASASPRHHITHAAHDSTRFAVHTAHHRVEHTRLAQAHGGQTHHSSVRRTSHASGRGRGTVADVTGLLQPNASIEQIAEIASPAGPPNPAGDIGRSVFGLIAIRRAESNEFADDRSARASWTIALASTV